MTEVLQATQRCWQYVRAAVREISTTAAVPGTLLTTQSLFVGALAGLLTYYLLKKRYRLPPGPRPLPLLGNLLWMRRRRGEEEEEEMYVTLDRWARERYGPVISFYFGPLLCVTLNDLDSITEALMQKGSDFSGRPSLHSFQVISSGWKGVLFADSTQVWKLHRKVITKVLRQCMSGRHLEKAVHDVMDHVVKKMATEPGACDPVPLIKSLVFHLIDSLYFGEGKPFDHPSIHRHIHLYERVFENWGNGFYEDIFPFLKYWPMNSLRKLVSSTDALLEYYDEQIQQHRESFSPDKSRHVTDGLLQAQREAAREESSEVMATFTDAHVRQILVDLVLAGVDTTTITLTWAMLLLAGHPEVQKRAQAEVDEAAGTGMPRLGQRGGQQLPYTQAVLYEVMRRGLASPFSMPYETTRHTSVGGYDVPKGTMVLANLWAVSFHSGLWHQPHVFRPERFLDDHGGLKPLPKAWLPFSMGRRACVGEGVAKPELLLLLACLLQRFTLSLPEGTAYDPSTRGVSLLYHLPKPYTILLTPR